MMSAMRRIDVQETLADEFEPGPLPPMGPDGAAQLEPVTELPKSPPRLCEAGPCRHYHTFQIQLDAQNPMRSRDGRVFHVKEEHFCYPDVGIETNLGVLPVLQCNRWDPVEGVQAHQFDAERAKAIRTTYDAMVEAWHQRRETERVQLVEAAIGKAIEVRVCVPIDRAPLLAGPRPPLLKWRHLDVEPDRSIDHIVRSVIAEHAVSHPTLGLAERAFTVELEDVTEPGGATFREPPATSRAPITNLNATVGELALETGSRLFVTFTPDKEIPTP